ncbi:MAG: glycoside hydrolase/phage tail family protein [Pseudomonadota bacterium]
MATMVLSAAGAAVGNAVLGPVLGTFGAVVGRAAGAVLGVRYDTRSTDQGASPVEVGHVDRFRVMGAAEATEIPRIYGRMRVAGQVIWASRFVETVTTTGGQSQGKGQPSTPSTNTYAYSVSLALGLCEGEVRRIGRAWADGQEISLARLTLRFYPGDETQLPDPLIQAIEGSAPSYRGTSYVVIEDLPLGSFGNRVPQFHFEVFRPHLSSAESGELRLDEEVRAVALGPSTGTYALSPAIVFAEGGKGVSEPLNVSSLEERSDFQQSLGQMRSAYPAATRQALTYRWALSDLRCALSAPQPRLGVEARADWSIAGLNAAGAMPVQGGVIDGFDMGTPPDAQVIGAIKHMKQFSTDVMLRPELILDIPAGAGLPDPWSDGVQAPRSPAHLLSLSKAADQPGSPQGSAAARTEIDAFLGTVLPSDFALSNGAVVYSGPTEWSYRRYILHTAFLCVAAGGVDSFCLGVGLRGLTGVRDGAGAVPFVQGLQALAADVRTVLGPDVKIGYAADWREYGPQVASDGSGEVRYPLDPLWADGEIDFVGIEARFPLTDWRTGETHLDADWPGPNDAGYIASGIEGGEGYDWAYASDVDRAAQLRTPITDLAYSDPWVFRPKDLRNWWDRPHWERPGGVRDQVNTPWVPQMKPIWLTSLGCPAVRFGLNTPEALRDPLWDDTLPYGSDGSQDDLVQRRLAQAYLGYWNAQGVNPASREYDGEMLDLGRVYLSRWDVRPMPNVASAGSGWPDAGLVSTGHGISPRADQVSVADVVRDVAARAGVTRVQADRAVGMVKGAVIGGHETARQSLQPIFTSFGLQTFEQADALVVQDKVSAPVSELDPQWFVLSEGEPVLVRERLMETENPERVRLTYVEADGAYLTSAVEARLPTDGIPRSTNENVPLALERGEARELAERMLSESHVARDTLQFVLPPSQHALAVGDRIRLSGDPEGWLYQIDRVNEGVVRGVVATRVLNLEQGIVSILEPVSRPVAQAPSVAAQTYPEFMDLPLLQGDFIAHAPYVAVTSTPWPGPVAVYSASEDYGYVLNTEVGANAIMGQLETPLPRGCPARWWRGTVEVSVSQGGLSAQPRLDVLNGRNLACLRNGQGDWEVIQFASASLVGEGRYLVSDVLRGQAGTEHVVPDTWPVGTDFVLLDGAAQQIGMPTAERGLERHYRVGPANLPYDSDAYVHQVHAFDGVGLRPYAPVHLRAERMSGGDISLTWLRRTRTDGDSWLGLDVPLGEASELYLVRVLVNGTPRREVFASQPSHVYTAAEQAVDGAGTDIAFEVAQVSDLWGPGPFGGLSFDN